MGFFTPSLILLHHPGSMTDTMTTTSNVLQRKKKTHFVHVLFEAAVDAVTL